MLIKLVDNNFLISDLAGFQNNCHLKVALIDFLINTGPCLDEKQLVLFLKILAFQNDLILFSKLEYAQIPVIFLK